MSLHLVNLSIVVLGDKHNPTIINPDFLRYQEIVPPDWSDKVISEEVITIPPIAQVPYRNGVRVQVEPHRAQFTDQMVQDPLKSEVVEITKKFVSILRHVHYQAVGMNFNFIKDTDKPDEYLQNRFFDTLKLKNLQPIRATSLKLVTELENVSVNLSIDHGIAMAKIPHNETEKSVILIEANYHKKCQSYPAHEEIATFINAMTSYWAHCKNLLEKI